MFKYNHIGIQYSNFFWGGEVKKTTLYSFPYMCDTWRQLLINFGENDYPKFLKKKFIKCHTWLESCYSKLGFSAVNFYQYVHCKCEQLKKIIKKKFFQENLFSLKNTSGPKGPHHCCRMLLFSAEVSKSRPKGGNFSSIVSRFIVIRLFHDQHFDKN